MFSVTGMYFVCFWCAGVYLSVLSVFNFYFVCFLCIVCIWCVFGIVCAWCVCESVLCIWQRWAHVFTSKLCSLALIWNTVNMYTCVSHLNPVFLSETFVGMPGTCTPTPGVLESFFLTQRGAGLIAGGGVLLASVCFCQTCSQLRELVHGSVRAALFPFNWLKMGKQDLGKHTVPITVTQQKHTHG